MYKQKKCNKKSILYCHSYFYYVNLVLSEGSWATTCCARMRINSVWPTCVHGCHWHVSSHVVPSMPSLSNLSTCWTRVRDQNTHKHNKSVIILQKDNSNIFHTSNYISPQLKSLQQAS